jgi:hypothetical protein
LFSARPGQSQISMINAVATIMMQLMQSYEMDYGIIGVDNFDRWPLDSQAFGFLEATSSAQSVDALMKVSSFPYESCLLLTVYSIHF